VGNQLVACGKADAVALQRHICAEQNCDLAGVVDCTASNEPLNLMSDELRLIDRLKSGVTSEPSRAARMAGWRPCIKLNRPNRRSASAHHRIWPATPTLIPPIQLRHGDRQ
jgi:hypothetical protein